MSNLFGQTKLRTILVVPFVLQIVGAVGLVGYLSFRNGQQAVNDLAFKLQRNVGERVDQHLDSYLGSAQQINQVNLNVIDQGLLDLNNLEQSGEYFWRQANGFKSLTYIGYNLENNAGAGAGFYNSKDPNPNLANHPAGGLAEYSYATDSQGNRTKLLAKIEYNAVAEDWYTATKKANKPTWRIYTYPELEGYVAASLNVPVYKRDRKLMGIMGVDLKLPTISEFLRKLKLSPNGKIFILERDGMLIASSSSGKPYKTVKGQTQRIRVDELQDPLILATNQQIQKRFRNLKTIQKDQQFDFQIDNHSFTKPAQRQFVQVTPWRDPYGLDWLIVVTVPESDFMGQINVNTRNTILLCIVALVIATLMGLLTSRWITQPIVVLSQASQAIANGDLSQTVKVQGVNELGILAQSFNQMAAQLRQSFAAIAQTNQILEDTNTDLEARVKERTAELLSAKDAADVANHAKSEFLANMSHELRTPLNAILGFTQVMNRDLTLNPDQQENLGIIGRSGDHLLALINDVLDMSKIEAGCITTNKSVFDIYSMLNTMADMLHLKAEAKGLTLLCQWTTDVPQYVKSDEKKLRQILLNLLGNAVKFTETGSVALRVQKGHNTVAEEPEIDSSKMFPLHFTVKDTGAGIAEHELNTLFDPFVQTETGRKSEQGTGLGLAISQKFVQLMGGDIKVKSKLAQGTTFEFEVQVEVSEAEPITTTLKSRRVMALEPGQPSYRILVVDDRWENRQLLIKLLTPIGFEVQEASNGQDAIAQWETWKPHLIWMDMRMPVMNGYETTQYIKSHLQGQATIIIALTASTLEEERAVVLSAGCEDFVRKPFLENEIFDKMAQHLGVRYVYAETAAFGLGQSISSKLDATVLNGMPTEWLTQLSYAAAQLDQQTLAQLLGQIPPHQADLRRSLQAQVDNFDFELLMTLAQDAAVL
jgi:signal transduction histidine kinase/DNA-binding response OmpR family regulator